MFVYVIECEDNSLYTGVTTSIEKRLSQHYLKLPQSAKYTKSHQMKNVLAVWKTEQKTDAFKLEYWIKTLNHSQKTNIINNNNLEFYFNEKLDKNKFEKQTDNFIKQLNSKIKNNGN